MGTVQMGEAVGQSGGVGYKVGHGDHECAQDASITFVTVGYPSTFEERRAAALLRGPP